MQGEGIAVVNSKRAVTVEEEVKRSRKTEMGRRRPKYYMYELKRSVDN